MQKRMEGTYWWQEGWPVVCVRNSVSSLARDGWSFWVDVRSGLKLGATSILDSPRLTTGPAVQNGECLVEAGSSVEDVRTLAKAA